jgi:hypothetical protein
MGARDYRMIYVFENDKVLTRFLDSGWSGSARTDLAAEADAAYSGAAEVAPRARVYQITENGLALQSTLQGMQFSNDDYLDEG